MLNFRVEVRYTDTDGFVWGDNKWTRWCDENCQGNFSIVGHNLKILVGEFELESDSILFILRWA
jgi:hypothetical protein